MNAAIREIKWLLSKLYGIDYARMDNDDHLADDWGIDRRERRRFEEELLKLYPSAPDLKKCQTIEDYARLVG